MKRVMEAEAPISRALMIKRIRQAWHIINMTEKMDNRLRELLDKYPVYISTHDDLEYFWIDEKQYREYDIFRPSSEREPADLPPEEIANGVKYILQQQISLPMQDLVKVTSQLFGFARSGPNIDAAMFRGIQEAARRDYIKFQNGRMVIK
ncbi:MAG: DUF3320 domain-containing protein [Tannerellaceae bacterium]|nr:DUF3320 domain-containing protein [Tannerellaceae bacterium]